MDSFSPFSQNQKQKKFQRPSNFIEALKDLGSSIKKQTKDATWGTGKGMVDQILGAPKTPVKPESGELQPEQPFNFEDYLKSKEKQIAARERQRYGKRIQEERLVFHRKHEEAKLQIKAVQEELKKLADTSQELSVEIKKATFTATVEPGTYHENFFDRIRRLIQLARKRISESKSWLETFNQRAKKRSHYWGQVKKSGTKFMLSQERYMSTQVG